MKYSTQTLIQKLDKGESLDYLFFWGHRPEKNQAVGKGSLSQWYARGFQYEGKLFPTAEHWMMAQKAIVFGDDDIRTKILQTNSPQEAKALGRKVKNFNAGKWDALSYEIVVKGNFLKFSQKDSFKKYLLSTGDRILVEASPYDIHWGIGMLFSDPRATNPREWGGKNKLGFALMEVRDMLK